MNPAPPRYAEAIERVLAHVAPGSSSDTLPLEQCAGRVLAEDVSSDRDLPPFNRAQMDGYALRAADFAPGKTFPLVGTVPAGHDGNIAVPVGSCVAIATGAPLPSDVDTVIQHEKSDRANPVSFTLDTIAPGHAVHPRGVDAHAGDVVIKQHTQLSAHHLGIAASVGKASLNVTRKPRVIILTSGDEIVPAEASPQTHQVRNSNGPMLSALCAAMGAEVVRSQHLPDELPAVQGAVNEALKVCDVLLTVGGISAGERDHFRNAFEPAHVEPIITRALLQPGGPIYVGKRGNAPIIVGLPGNPVSVLACACLFVWPIVRRMLHHDGALPWRNVELTAPVKPNPSRQAYRPAILGDDNRATVPKWAGSGDLVHTAITHGLLELPIQQDDVAVGTLLRFLPWP